MTVQTEKSTIEQMNALSADDFLERFGGLYEHSPWVVQAVLPQRPFATLTAFHAALSRAVAEAGEDRQTELLRAHPDLAGRAALAGELTGASTDEQSSAGLDSLTAEELNRFTALNTAYLNKFSVPFIMAVRGANKHKILAAFARRIDNTVPQEYAAALVEVDKIAWMRLLTLVDHAPTGGLTTHVLDTAAGKPAAGMPITLWRLDGAARTLIGSYTTNADGRLDAPALKGPNMQAGIYEWLFQAGIYFAGVGHVTSAPPFLDEIPLRFSIANPESHYHVPLLLSPWSLSTYRGS